MHVWCLVANSKDLFFPCNCWCSSCFLTTSAYMLSILFKRVVNKKLKHWDCFFLFWCYEFNNTWIYWISQDHSRKWQSWRVSTFSFSTASCCACATAMKSHPTQNPYTNYSISSACYFSFFFPIFFSYQWLPKMADWIDFELYLNTDLNKNNTWTQISLMALLDDGAGVREQAGVFMSRREAEMCRYISLCSPAPGRNIT